VPVTRALRERFYRHYLSFFETAERTRRWNVFNDIPWDKVESGPRNERLAVCAETFCGVESYLPDYLGSHVELVRETCGRAWFAANWGYEESKHALVLREYLIRSGQRTSAQMFDFEERLLAQRWEKPFETDRQMTIYGALQEMTTFVIYKKQEKLAASENDEALATVYRFIARDEMAHTRFYEDMIRYHLEDDREGTLADLAHVFKHFRMPAENLVPDYAARVEVMRTAGIDRGVFFNQVWAPMLKTLHLTRHDLPRPWTSPEVELAPGTEGR
jgi:acyl-[acyl-carrier-protein] desaturase